MKRRCDCIKVLMGELGGDVRAGVTQILRIRKHRFRMALNQFVPL